MICIAFVGVRSDKSPCWFGHCFRRLVLRGILSFDWFRGLRGFVLHNIQGLSEAIFACNCMEANFSNTFG
jgi:hypothetical protein